ncbi:hypothetical protein BLNAU_14728 [Blattamonas nauphoetae]|uniref:Right handed beta helix domain-containing protein n=1 Tax=Blattamonas nauphoetae TaxID=2049346 RepID=A0ABQ9XCS7_9EUKA|nr:hypothetical protein BLNAU_14728 [Blattamonas nauphoetae]
MGHFTDLYLNGVGAEEPIRITSAECSLGGGQQKSAVVTLTGVKLGGGNAFNVTVQKMVESTLIGDGIVLSGILAIDSSSPTHTHSELIFGISNPLLSFGTKYSITAFEVSGSISTVDAGVTFAVPAEPPRIVRLETRHLTKDRTTMIVSLEGHSLLLGAGKVNLSNGTHTWESLSDVIVVDNTNCTAEFAVAEEETVGAGQSRVDFMYTTPLLASPLTVPFVIGEGVQRFWVWSLTLNFSFVNLASFATAKDSDVELDGNRIQLLKSTSQATQGGVLFSEGSRLSLIKATFSNCQAEQGGAIHARLLSTHSLTVKGCTFDGCSCTEGGGGIYVDLRSSTLADKTQQVVLGTTDDYYPTRFKGCISDDGRGHGILVDMNPSDS